MNQAMKIEWIRCQESGVSSCPGLKPTELIPTKVASTWQLQQQFQKGFAPLCVRELLLFGDG
jgi:hypothetical protein